MHGTVALGKKATIQGAVGEGVLMMLTVHVTMKGTNVFIHGTVRRST